VHRLLGAAGTVDHRSEAGRQVDLQQLAGDELIGAGVRGERGAGRPGLFEQASPAAAAVAQVADHRGCQLRGVHAVAVTCIGRWRASRSAIWHGQQGSRASVTCQLGWSAQNVSAGWLYGRVSCWAVACTMLVFSW